MIIRFDPEGTVTGFCDILNRVLETKSVEGVFVLACDANGFGAENLKEVLKKVPVPIWGGIFPAIIHGKEKHEKGTIVIGLFKKPIVRVIPNLSDSQVDYEKLISAGLPDHDAIKTMFVLVDGFAKRINALIESMFNVFGLEVNYLGGGAGSMTMVQKPCLITNNGLLADSAILAMLDMQSGIGVCHGWQTIGGPFKVTESDRNTIRSLDWKPAFEVYRAVVEEHAGRQFTQENFFDLAKCYPFGISKLGAEKIVRDPFMREDSGALVCVGEVPQESFVHILSGDVNALVGAASNARAMAEQSFPNTSLARVGFFMDCISRVLFLQNEFSRELDAVYHEQWPLVGALTIGEIANNGKEYLEFYNKTAVVGLLEA